MKKVLLVYEDYAEQTTTEVLLKKIGFDVVGIGNEVLLSDKLLVFNPDIVVAFGKSQRVSSVSVAQKLWDHHKYAGKVVLILPPATRLNPSDLARLRLDAMMEAPVTPEKLIQVLAKYSQQDPGLLIEKFNKAKLSDPALLERLHITAKRPDSDQQRVAKYKKFLDDVHFDTKETSFDKQQIKTRQKEMKKDWDFDELEKLDELKRQFADALFKKS